MDLKQWPKQWNEMKNWILILETTAASVAANGPTLIE